MASVHYLDHAATTPMRPEALAALTEVSAETYGNPSGAHRLARAAQRRLDEARMELAAALGAQPGEIVFTGGGSEADNLAVRGVIEATGGVAVASAIEHHAVLDPVEHLGGRVVAVEPDGRIDLDALAAAVAPADGPPAALVSVMAANNETGIVQPLADVRRLIDELAPDAVLHVDAVQALCWLDVAELWSLADLLAISAHKFGGPKGVGALLVGDGVPLAPQIRGGGQERERRSGTQNVAGIAAMAAAATATVADRPATVERTRRMRDRLADGLLAAVDGAVESGIGEGRAADRRHKTANVAHLCLDGVESESLLFVLERSDVLASAASSCASGALDPSHVLAAMGYDRSQAGGSLRLSLGATTTDADIDAALEAVPAAVDRIRRVEHR